LNTDDLRDRYKINISIDGYGRHNISTVFIQWTIKMIETRVLKQFVVVAEVLNFHRAAEQLHMSQPPLSVAIRQLEEKLGVTLLIRDRGGVTLTPAGEAFLAHAREMLHAMSAGIHYVRNVARGMAGKLTLSSVSLASYPRLLAVLRQFRQTYPQVELVIKEMPSALQINAVQRGDVDLAFIRKPAQSVKACRLTHFVSEEILLAVPAEHLLASHSTVDLQALATEDFVFTPPALGEGYYHHLMGLCQQAGFYPRIVQEAAQLSTLIALVSCGFGVALVPESVAKTVANQNVRFVTLTALGDVPRVDLFMLHGETRPDTSVPLTNFLAILDATT
jgi:DNA-binding transcriptional LysR family regulator